MAVDETPVSKTPDGDLKLCPFCAEPIRAAAIKCKHCGEFLNKKTAAKWYFRGSFVIAALLFLGPFALPLVWFNPGYARRTKWLVTGVVLALTWLLGSLVIQALTTLNNYYKVLFEMY